jgi:phosphate transporter
VTALYARCVTRGDSAAAKKALALHQREHIAWERDTVWRTMLNHARGAGPDRANGAIVDGTPRVVGAEEEKALLDVPSPLGRVKVTKRVVSLLVAIAAGVALLNVQAVDGEEASRCLAVLVFCTILWATEVYYLFAVLQEIG